MSRSRRALFFIGILIIVALALIGSYFALIALGELDKDDGKDPSPTKITYSFDIQTKEYFGEVYGSCKVVRSKNLLKGHYDEITFTFDESTNTYNPKLVIFNQNGQDVTSEYQLSIKKQYSESDTIKLYVKPQQYVEFNGIFADAYKDTASLEYGYYLLGNCSLQAEMDVSSFNSKSKVANFNVKVVDKNGNELDLFTLDNVSYSSTLKDRVLKIKLFYVESLGLSYYEVVEGSLLEKHELKLKYYGYEEWSEIKIYDELQKEVTRYYDIIIVEYN